MGIFCIMVFMWIVSFKIIISMKRVFEICKYAFLIFVKGDKQKICARYFEIRKYSFLIFEKGDKQKICARYFEIRKYAF